MIVKVMKEVGHSATCCGSSSLSSDGSVLDDNGVDSFFLFNQAAHTQIAFNDSVTSCINEMTEETNNQTQQLANALMMLLLDHQTKLTMAEQHFRPEWIKKKDVESINCF